MKQQLLSKLGLAAATARSFLLLGLGYSALTGIQVSAQAPTPGTAILEKRCDHCGRSVSLDSEVGQRCPHCGAYWADKRNTLLDTDGPRSTKQAKAPSSTARELGALKPSLRKTWPRFAHRLFGRNQLTFHNHTDADVWIGLRSGPHGSDLRVAAQGTGYFSLPAGMFQTYVSRLDRPKSLFEGGNIKITETSRRYSQQTVCLWADEDVLPPKESPGLAGH